MRMMSVFTSKNTFEKKYPLFNKYVLDENIRNNMLQNEDLYRKYNVYSSTISTFIHELDKRFDVETINRIIIEAILKTPDEIMVSLITSYLNSDECTKSNSDFILFYNRTSSFGKDSIKYLEENGIIANRSYKDVPYIAIDARFKELHNENMYFKGEEIGEVFNKLDYKEKKYLNTLLEMNAFKDLEPIFERMDFNLKTLLSFLTKKNIDPIIFKNEVLESLGHYNTMIGILTLLENEDNVRILNNIRFIIQKERYELLKNIIIYGKILELDVLDINIIDSLEDYEIMDLFNTYSYTLKKVED